MHVCLANDLSITYDIHYKSICMSMCVRAKLTTQFGMHPSTNGGDVHQSSPSSWNNAVLGTQLGKVCYHSITYSSAPPAQASHVSPALDRLPALLVQVWLTGLE